MLIPPPDLVALLKHAKFLAVDPGLLYPAAAAFVNGVLVAASRVKVPGSFKKLRGLDEGECARQIAELVATWGVTALGGMPDVIVYEWPKVYPNEHSKDPNDLMPLVAIGASVAARLCVRAISVRPAEWIGQIPKAKTGDPWLSPRGGIIASRITPAERAAIVPSHDAVDAGGIGLWALGRLGKRYPGSV